jgi:hypothetical protein
MTLIKYNPELIEFETPTNTIEGQEDTFVPSFKIINLAYKDLYTFGLFTGDLSIFQGLNDVDGIPTNYEIINELPKTGINYYSDTKHGTPSSINDMLKYKARSRIENEVGDTDDLISDLSKRVTMLERLCIRMADDLIKNSPEHVPTIAYAYTDMVNAYLQLQIQHSNVTNIADLEDPMTLFIKLFNRSVQTTQIVKEDYFDKKV